MSETTAIQTPPKEVLRYWEMQRAEREVVALRKVVEKLNKDIGVKDRKISEQIDSYNKDTYKLYNENTLLRVVVVLLAIATVVFAIL